MNEFLTIPAAAVGTLTATPGGGEVSVTLDGHRCRVRVAIPGLESRITRHYENRVTREDVAKAVAVGVARPFRDFGLIFHFEHPSQIHLYDDDDMVLAPDVKRLIDRFGPVIFRNAYMPEKCRARGQRNIFPDLNFHYDRSPLQENKYSLFCRDPFDPVQRHRRQSSTLIVPNMVAYLQHVHEGNPPETGSRALYSIFKNMDLEPLLGDILLEQPWREPNDTGEICVIDNRTVVHASFYRTGKGYPIGVRYLF